MHACMHLPICTAAAAGTEIENAHPCMHAHTQLCMHALMHACVYRIMHACMHLNVLVF